MKQKNYILIWKLNKKKRGNNIMTVKRICRSISFSPRGYEVIQYLQHQCNINVSKHLEKLLLNNFEKDMKNSNEVMKGEK